MTGATNAAPLKSADVPGELVMICVGTVLPVRSQVGADPLNVSVVVTFTCSPVTAILLASVAVDAVTGPLPVRLVAVRLTLLAPALMEPAFSVFASVKLIPVGAVAVTVAPKSLVVFARVIAPPVEVTLVVPLTASGPVWVTLPADASVRLPALLVASCVEELVFKTT